MYSSHEHAEQEVLKISTKHLTSNSSNLNFRGSIMARYQVEAVAYDKDGRRLNGNTHSIDADSASEAERIAASRQKSHVGTAKVETKILHKSDK